MKEDARAGHLIFFIDADFRIQKFSKRLIQELHVDHVSQHLDRRCFSLFYNLEEPCRDCPVARAIAFKTTVEEEIKTNTTGKDALTRFAMATPILENDGEIRRLVIDCLGADVHLYDEALPSQNNGDGDGAVKAPAGIGTDSDKNPMDKSLFAELIKKQSRFAGRLAHDIKNPLALISTNLDFIARDIKNAQKNNEKAIVLDYVEQIKTKVQQIVEILDLANILKVHNWDQVAECDLQKLLQRVITNTLLSTSYPNSDIQSRMADGLPKIITSELYLERALTELLKALLANSGEDGLLNIELSYRDKPDDFFLVEIHCNHQNKTFDVETMLQRFYIEKEEWTAIEISLLIAYATILIHSGSLETKLPDDEQVQLIVKIPRLSHLGGDKRWENYEQ